MINISLVRINRRLCVIAVCVNRQAKDSIPICIPVHIHAYNGLCSYSNAHCSAREKCVCVRALNMLPLLAQAIIMLIASNNYCVPRRRWRMIMLCERAWIFSQHSLSRPESSFLVVHKCRCIVCDVRVTVVNTDDVNIDSGMYFNLDRSLDRRRVDDKHLPRNIDV